MSNKMSSCEYFQSGTRLYDYCRLYGIFYNVREYTKFSDYAIPEDHYEEYKLSLDFSSMYPTLQIDYPIPLDDVMPWIVKDYSFF